MGQIKLIFKIYCDRERTMETDEDDMLLAQLTEEEIAELSKTIDPDVRIHSTLYFPELLLHNG